MKNSPYKRKPGDFEVRILSDGRVVMIAPDEELLEVAKAIDPNSSNLAPETENEKYA
jgi:hypothetical protein